MFKVSYMYQFEEGVVLYEGVEEREMNPEQIAELFTDRHIVGIQVNGIMYQRRGWDWSSGWSGDMSCYLTLGAQPYVY